MLQDLLTTTDRFGCLMPSYCGTKFSDEAKALGLVEDSKFQEIPWPMLTEKGKEMKASLVVKN